MTSFIDTDRIRIIAFAFTVFYCNSKQYYKSYFLKELLEKTQELKLVGMNETAATTSVLSNDEPTKLSFTCQSIFVVVESVIDT
jgi:hypothetical protein